MCVIAYYHFLLLRYTYNSNLKAVYGIALKYPSNYVLSIGAVVPSQQSTVVTLLGYGQLKWTYEAPLMNVTMPYLPLDSDLRWGWTLRFENASPAMWHLQGQNRAQL